MRRAALLAALAISGLALGAGTRSPVRIRVHHADPYLIKALLEGRAALAPEVSTVMLAGGPLLIGAVQAATMFTGGHLIVNPTDNSLWFIPDRG